MSLSADQIALLSRLLDQALPLDATARQTWLRNLQPEYAALAPALRQALLPDGDETFGTGLFATLPRIGAAAAHAAAGLTSMLQAGERIGPYQLMRELGHGGMAVVRLAP